MGARHADRLWIVAGMVVVALLGIATWFLAVSPQRAEAAGLADQTATSRAQADELRARIVKLTADKASLGTLMKTLNAGKVALPADSGVPSFLRQLQTTEPAVRVAISSVALGDPELEETVPGVWSVEISLNAEGTLAKLGDFLKRLQTAAKTRAVLVESANLTGNTEARPGNPGDWTLSFSLKAFVAPPAGSGAPAITTD
jgi:type IV pilus assembly protein PilO